jgi:hypothetical protein
MMARCLAIWYRWDLVAFAQPEVPTTCIGDRRAAARCLDSQNHIVPTDWAFGGSCYEDNVQDGADLWSMPVETAEPGRRPFLNKATRSVPRFSDGRWAVERIRPASGLRAPFPGRPGSIVSTAGRAASAQRRQGVLSPDGGMMGSAISEGRTAPSPGGAFQRGSWQRRSTLRYQYAVAPTAVLINVVTAEPPPPPLTPPELETQA